jgi:hypothetical protein
LRTVRYTIKSKKTTAIQGKAESKYSNPANKTPKIDMLLIFVSKGMFGV